LFLIISIACSSLTKIKKQNGLETCHNALEISCLPLREPKMRCGSSSKIKQPVTFLFGSALPPIRRSSSRKGFLERIKAGFKTKILKLGDWTAFVLAE
jgi:hypothetical protein